MNEKKQNMAPMWKKLTKHIDILTNQLHFLIAYTWDALNGERKPNESIINEYEEMFESRISAGARIGKASRKNGGVLKDFANWQTKT